MATYSLSGSGTHVLTSDTTGLQVTITTPSDIQGVGTANPANHYHTGMLRFSDGTAYWDPVPITGGPQFIPVPQNATSFGYAMQGGAHISVAEVIGGTVFFSGGASSLASLSDITLASIADGQLLKWVTADGKWENFTPSAGAGATPHKFTLITRTGTKNTSSTTFVVIDNTNLPALSLTLALNDVVYMELCGFAFGNTINMTIGFDIQVVQPTLGTTRCCSPAAAGCTACQIPNNGFRSPIALNTGWVAAEAGAHSFQPMFNVNFGTGSVLNAAASQDTDTAIFFAVRNLGPHA